MIDLLDDLNQAVTRSAACALGQMGRIEARPMIARLLREEPSEEVIDAVSPVADEECIVPIQTRLVRCGTRRVREYRPPPCQRDGDSDPGTGLGHDVRRQPMNRCHTETIKKRRAINVRVGSRSLPVARVIFQKVQRSGSRNKM
jgi:hypothetical protein